MSQQNEKQSQKPQRAYKANPVVQTRDAATKRRRELFFKRVQDNREERKWGSRGEQVRHYLYSDQTRTDHSQLQQLDFVSERKRWENKKAQEAPREEEDFDDELLSEAKLPQSSSDAAQYEPEMSEADYVLEQEEHELQQLIAAMEQEQSQDTAPQQHFGSDDDDYDQIFMECAADADTRYQQQPQAHDSSCRDVDDMDMTDG